MERALFDSSQLSDKGFVSEYAHYYESEDDTFKNFWRRVNTRIKSRYKILTDKNIRQQRKSKKARIQLKQVGLHGFDLLKPETFYIANLLKPKEKIVAAICGRIESGSSVLMVLTDSRFLYLDIIPLFTTIQEIGFGVIEAVRINIGQFDATVCVYTSVGNFTLNNVALDAASNFVNQVEALIEVNQTVILNQK